MMRGRHLPNLASGLCTARGQPPLSLAQLRERVFVIAGPNVIESEDQALRTAAALRLALERYDASFIFKASFDKANRTSASSYRGVSLDRAARLFERVRSELGVPVLTDVHETHQPAMLAHCVDVFQIPAFLCRRGPRTRGRGVRKDQRGWGGTGRVPCGRGRRCGEEAGRGGHHGWVWVGSSAWAWRLCGAWKW
jgi:hypothetical protein